MILVIYKDIYNFNEEYSLFGGSTSPVLKPRYYYNALRRSLTKVLAPS